METESDHLEIARQRTATERSADSLAKLYRAAHDIRGQAATLGFPLAGEIADGLCLLIERLGERLPPQDVIDRHVESIRAIVREDVRHREHPIGEALVARLAALREQLAPPLDGA
jgi:chemotaxis protein histidine kinase CheA